MRLTVRQLKRLIKEAVKETLKSEKNFMPKPDDAPEAWGVPQGNLGGYPDEFSLYQVAQRTPGKKRSDGGRQYVDGRIEWPGGEMQYPDGTIEFPNGRLRNPDGTLSWAQGEDNDLKVRGGRRRKRFVGQGSNARKEGEGGEADPDFMNVPRPR